MADVLIDWNETGWRDLATGPEVAAVALAEAELAKGYAEAFAPRRTGHYAASFEVTEVAVLLNEQWRAAARLENTAGYAAAVEYGYRGRAAALGQSAHRVLTRTLERLAGTNAESEGAE